MTTIAEFKQMLQEEINKPLDYPRVPGLSAEELRDYNEGYQVACRIVAAGYNLDDEKWLLDNLDALEGADGLALRYADETEPWERGRHAAYTWALAELKALEPESQTFGKMPEVVVDGFEANVPLRPMMFSPLGVSEDSVLIPRARYNYLLELERSVTEFTESFARWEA